MYILVIQKTMAPLTILIGTTERHQLAIHRVDIMVENEGIVVVARISMISYFNAKVLQKSGCDSAW